MILETQDFSNWLRSITNDVRIICKYFILVADFISETQPLFIETIGTLIHNESRSLKKQNLITVRWIIYTQFV